MFDIKILLESDNKILNNEIESTKKIVEKYQKDIDELNNNIQITELNNIELIKKQKNYESVIENLNEDIKKYKND